MREIAVTWETTSGVLSAGTTRTDSAGYAEVRWTLGTLPGIQKATARIEQLPDTVAFAATVQPGAPARVEVTPTESRVRRELSVDLEAQATDRHGNPVHTGTFHWASEDPDIAGVDGSGRVTGMRRGATSVIASVGNAKGSAQVVVEPNGWLSISAGFAHTCGLTDEGVAYCWGWRIGELPVKMDESLRFRALSAGYDHACGITAAGEAYCWGENHVGQLGDGTETRRSAPARVEGTHRWKELQAGPGRTCGITEAGAAYCWGANSRGEVGDGTRINRNRPTLVQGGHRFTSISTGGGGLGPGPGQTCAVAERGDGFCWGVSYLDPIWTEQLLPTPIDGNWMAISNGELHICGIRSNGAAYCWGANAYAQLGVGNWGAGIFAQSPVVGAHLFIGIESSIEHTCAVTRQGEAYCWGDGASRRTGGNSDGFHPAPSQVLGGFRFLSVTAGGYHSCGVTVRDEAVCWGSNLNGQLGTGRPGGAYLHHFSYSPERLSKPES